MTLIDAQPSARSDESPTVVADRRRGSVGPRLSWASQHPFAPRPAAYAAPPRDVSWRAQERFYQETTLARDVVLCTFVPTMLLFVLHGVSLLQLAWGGMIGLTFVAMVAVERGYDRAGIGDGPLEFEAILRGGVLTAAGLALFAVGLDVTVPRSVFFGALPMMVGVLVVSRLVVRRNLHRRRGFGEAMRRTLIVGDDGSIHRIAEDLRATPYHGYDIAGACVPRYGVRGADTIPVLGLLADIPQVVVDGEFDVVLIAGSELSGQALRRLSWALEQTKAELIVAPGLVEVFGPRVVLEPTAGLSLIHVRRMETSQPRKIVKRTFDLAAAVVGLLLALPLLVAASIVIKATSPGPVLFRQTRIGKDGREFSMLKFRSMVVDAEGHLESLLAENQAEGPIFKLHDDPRVTRVGRFLRKHSVDEIPQLINVLRGEMSIVGPRPPLAREAAQYEEATRRRLRVKPGVTGLWQISGRADLPWLEAVKLDLRYVENWSVALDFMIMWKTVRVVLGGHGGR